ncbi:tyrosine-type recombinase/integrase [Halorarius litoreus]|uniref:tyrosine-type recombinase/integrase n=1 Tax=Halorarius litoreus TaxID=2962676 RepID=UPI0020CB83AD|nr:site-specific integrase [Halorarius litoreus]
MTDQDHSREEIAAAFGRSTDPLAQYASTFETISTDPFEVFLEDALTSKDIAPRTERGYHRVIKQWKTHMETEGRHPACPAIDHLRRFIHHEQTEKGNHPDTISEKLRKLEEVYRFWQSAPSFPHTQEYNPFTVVKQTVSMDAPEQKKLPNIPFTELRDIISRIDRLRDLVIICLQLKLGLRASEVCNLVLGELDVSDDDLQSHHPEIGDHWMLDGRPNAVYIPHDRYGNKSGRPRVLPLDEELEDILTRYLLVRPDTGVPWVIVSQKGHKLTKQFVTETWRRWFHPEYAETEHHRSVLSHYGRHRFTTYWRVQQDLPRPLVKYMRGDRPDSESVTDRAGIDEYIHTYYEDIEPVYRREIYRLL